MKRFFDLSLGAVLVFCVLVLPNHPGTMSWGALNRWPLELPVILLTMIAIGRYRTVPSLVALFLVVSAMLKLADYGTFTAYNRTFNPVIDLFLIQAGLDLLRDSIGGARAILAIVGFVLAMAGLFLALRYGLKAWSRLPLSRPLQAAAVAGVVLSGGWAVADAGHHLRYWRFESSPPGTAWTSRLIAKRASEMQATAADLVRFRREAQIDTLAGLSGVLDRLQGRDVLLIWVESYGRASFDNPLYTATHGATLSRAEDHIAAAGMSMKSGWLTSPTAGGESWLAHGALASGLWTSDNGRYNAMIASGHKWLFHFAQEAGYRTSAIMPAITLGWPESAAMGFDLIFPAAQIPYRGERFNWVTMPDQFTLSASGSLLPVDERPDFMQIALISSHAPWTPIPELLPWDALGDGTVFNEMARQGPTPRALWKDRDAIRDAYRRSLDYALQAVFGHVARMGAQAPLIIVLGDHQAAGFVAGGDNRDVPIHFIGPSDLLARIDHWGWADGLFPASDGPVRRMDRFRDDFITAFTSTEQTAEMRP